MDPDSMVLMYLSKVTQFADIVANTPRDVSKRVSKLLNLYQSIKDEFTDVVVSVKIPASLERYKEVLLDNEDEIRKVQVLEYLIEKFSKDVFHIIHSNSKIYLFPSVQNCKRKDCHDQRLILCNPDRTENSVNIFTVRGGTKGEVYRKKCGKCLGMYYYNYFEVADSAGKIIRSYYSGDEVFFSITNETFFEKKLLEHLTEDLGMN